MVPILARHNAPCFRRRVFAMVAACTLLIAAVCFVGLRGTRSTGDAPTQGAGGEIPVDARAAEVALTAETRAGVEAFCGDCHALPRPESLTWSRWYFGVRKGYEFYAKSGRGDLHPPAFSDALAYFRERAPRALTFAAASEAAGQFAATFKQERFGLGARPAVLEISHLLWVPLAAGETPVLVACDMRSGEILAVDLASAEPTAPRVLARLRHPARVEPCDWERDGRPDLLVADLGSYLPADHDRGRVVLLRGLPDGTYRPIELAAGLGRVADVRPADVDGDGDPDLIVAEFGWQQTGGIALLENVSARDGEFQFERIVLDDRPGAIHVPVHDFNGDGRPDFAALVSQEHETIDLFLNLGRSPSDQPRFSRRNVWAGADLTFGASGIELVDLNQDGNVDVLYTNGDTFDNLYASPWHGVGWLEQRPGREFVHHRLSELPGAYRALPDDFDTDGDLDVVVTAWLPANVEPAELRGSRLAAIVLLEQTAPGEFARHTLEWGWPMYATPAVGDFDGDGDSDFTVAPGPNVAEAEGNDGSLRVWWNESVPSAE